MVGSEDSLPVLGNGMLMVIDPLPRPQAPEVMRQGLEDVGQTSLALHHWWGILKVKMMTLMELCCLIDALGGVEGVKRPGNYCCCACLAPSIRRCNP